MTRPRPSTVSPDELRQLAGRLFMASGSVRIPKPLRDDLTLAGLVLTTLLRTGVITSPISWKGERDG